MMAAADKQRLIIGMGESGYSLASFWYGDGDSDSGGGSGYTLVAADDRKEPPQVERFHQVLPRVQTKIGVNFRCWGADEYTGYDKIALSPGVSPSCVQVEAARLTNDAACFSDAWQEEAPASSRLLAVTGTNGKSTVVTLATHLINASGCRAVAVGNIGQLLLLSLLDWRRNGFPAVAVAELSSFQLELAQQFYSDAAVVLNVGDDHLDRHGTMERYAAIKYGIYHNTRCAVVNTSLATSASASAPADAGVTYGGEGGKEANWTVRDGAVWRGNEKRYSVAAMSAVCRNYPDLVLAALALIDGLDLPPATVQAGLASFAGLPHRRQVVVNDNGVIYINDSKATNVEAALFALRHAGGDVVWIGGGDGKGQDFSPLGRVGAGAGAATAGSGRMKAAVLLGKDAAAIEVVLLAAGVRCSRAADMQEAVAHAHALAVPGDVVLLSPACASTDMFADYQVRGMEFMRAVKDLLGGQQDG